jgi:class 3 adenylate cyclase
MVFDFFSLLVIGSKVNMAARLMMNYPSIVSCDEETYKAAITKLNKQDFESLPFKQLKGIGEPGVIREYNKDHEYGLSSCRMIMLCDTPPPPLPHIKELHL